MRYYKLISDGYLLSIGKGGTQGEEITETEYYTILETIRNTPTAPDGYGYRLTAAMEREQYELSPEDLAETMTETEEKAAAYDILMGVSE